MLRRQRHVYVVAGMQRVHLKMQVRRAIWLLLLTLVRHCILPRVLIYENHSIKFQTPERQH
jgi:hypothetical protein